MPKPQDFFEKVAELIIEQLKQGTAPWQKPWDGGQYGSMPMNPTTNKRYKGGNALHLMAQKYDDPRWMTYKQAEAHDAQVKKGEHGTPVIYWKFHEEQTVKDDKGKPEINEQGQHKKILVELERPKSFISYVFNAQQIDGLPELIKKTDREWSLEDRAEAILTQSGAKIEHKKQPHAYYRPSTDSITLPQKEQFPSAEGYYSTALHELGHWTGHESRLNRDLMHPFGSEGYAREELRAEIASMMLGQELGAYTPNTEKHAAYVGCWIKALEENPNEIFRAAADAEKILDYVMGLELKQVQKTVQAMAQDESQSEMPRMDVKEDLQHGAQNQEQTGRTYLAVPYAEKNDAKDLGAKWDRGQGAWYVPDGLDMETFKRWEIVKNQDKDIGSEPLLANEVGISAMPHAHQGLLSSEEWAKAKAGDYEAAKQLVEKHWNDDKTEELRKKINPGTQITFVTVPSSTDRNQIPLALAAKIAKTIEGNIVDGGNLFKVADDLAMKNIAKLERVFCGRRYIPKVDSTKLLRDKQIVLVEDVLTTGSSAYAVVRALRQQNIQVQTVAGLMGDARLTPEPQLINSLKDVLKRTGVSTKAKELAGVLSRGEIKSIIEIANKIQKKDVDNEFTQKIQRLFDKRTNQSMEQNTNNEGRGDTRRNGIGHEGSPEGIQTVTSDMGERPREGKGRNAVEGTRSSERLREYLNVPYLERREAKAAGAKWDSVAKSWYAGEGANMEKLAKWLPGDKVEQAPAMTPKEEFGETLRSLGCILNGNHPMMDGKTHRISVEGDKTGVASGFYVGHLDGHPAGYAKNNRSGEETHWKSQGAIISAEQRQILAAQCAQNKMERVQAVAEQQEKTALRVLYQLKEMTPVIEPTPYMQSKGIVPQKGAYLNQDGKTLCVPAQDAEGKIRTMQYIQADGTKRFAKNGRKDASFHPVGGMDAVLKAPALVICEGYATASSLAMSLGQGIVAAFDASNLVAVAKALHSKYPDKAIVIAGDDDRHLLDSPVKKNPGREKAELAAQSVGGLAVFPVFATGEVGRDFTDFNDLATKSRLGNEAVTRQMRPAIEKACAEKTMAQEQEQKQRNTHKQSR